MTRDILELIANELDLQVNRDEVREIERLIECEDDFYIEIDGQEYRFINEAYIWDFYVQGIKDLTRDGARQWWIAIDWEKTAENCYQADGYGHHFGTYDGNEYYWQIGEESFYIFRTN